MARQGRRRERLALEDARFGSWTGPRQPGHHGWSDEHRGSGSCVAGLTVMVSLLGMILMRLKFLNGLAVGTATSVFIAVRAAMTLLPALLCSLRGPSLA